MIDRSKLIAFAVVLSVFLWLSAIGHAQQPYSYSKNYGKIKRIYSRSDGVYFRLKGGETAALGPNGYYMLKRDHANYDALTALLYLVAAKKWVVKVRVPEPPYQGNNRAVVYLVVDR